MPPGGVIGSCHDLWWVEQSFLMSNRARPMFARTRDAIEAHLTIVFTALAVSWAVQDRTGLSLRRVLRTLRPLRAATAEINGVITTIPPALGPDDDERSPVVHHVSELICRSIACGDFCVSESFDAAERLRCCKEAL